MGAKGRAWANAVSPGHEPVVGSGCGVIMGLYGRARFR